MAQQIYLTTVVKNSQVVKLVSEATKQQSYHTPEAVDLGKASELLKGGDVYACMDCFCQGRS